VIPHHGGAPGGASIDAFTDKLLDLVQPESVVFSNGAGRHDNPRPEIVQIACGRGCQVACTELSARCGGPIADNKHLEDVRSYGRASGCSCAGSITLDLDPGAARIAGADDKHREFVEKLVPTPMCLGKAKADTPSELDVQVIAEPVGPIFGGAAK
jgi:competence protein ComEC